MRQYELIFIADVLDQLEAAGWGEWAYIDGRFRRKVDDFELIMSYSPADPKAGFHCVVRWRYSYHLGRGEGPLLNAVGDAVGEALSGVGQMAGVLLDLGPGEEDV